MKLFNTLTKKIITAVVAIAAIAGITSVAMAGFGPDRPTKAWNPSVSGFDHVVFNSFTGVGNGIGDERDFLRGSIVGTGANWSDPVNDVTQNSEVEVKIYIHNNADATLNESGQGVAKNVNVKVAVPNASAKAQDITSWISADNADPKTIFDTLSLTGANGGFFEMSPVLGSAVLHNADGSTSAVGDGIFTNGVNIGDQPGCFQYRREITFRVKIKMPNYSIKKETKVYGQGSWVDSVNGTATDTYSWMVTFANTGETQLKDVMLVDNIPSNMTVVPGSVKLTNGNYPNGFVYDSTAVQNNGKQINVNIGDYAPGINAFLTYRTTVSDANALTCGANQFVNEAFTTPNGYGSIRDTATVQIVKEGCNTPVYTCNSLAIDKIGGRKVRATVSTTASPSDRVKVQSFEYNFGDGASSVLNSNNSSAEYTYTKDGTYKVSVKVSFMVDNVNQVVASASCSKTVTFTSNLPQTGAGSSLGLFLVATVLGMFGYRAYAVRKEQ